MRSASPQAVKEVRALEEDLEVGQPEWSLDVADWHWLDGGYAIPQRFTVPVSTPRWQARIDVEVSGGKARTRGVTVATEEPGGVTYSMMQQVPIRRAVARGALNLLRRAVVTKDGTTKLAPFTLSERKEAHTLLKRVIGYVEVTV
jgi:hypothetical protein